MSNPLHIPHILSITLSYVDPPNLHKFFIFHHLNENIPFTYNALSHELTDETIWNVYKLFPRISLTGVRLRNTIVKDTQFLTKISPKLIHINIDASLPFGGCLIPKHCVNLHTLETNHLTNDYIVIFKNNPNIRTIKMPTIRLTNNGLSIISSTLPNLTHLTFGGCNSPSNYYLLCENLRYINIIRSNTIESLFILTGCPNIRTIKLDSCQHLTNLDTLESFTKLKLIQITSCDQLQTITFPPRIHRIKLTNCPQLQIISSLTKNFKLRSAIFTRCPRIKLSEIVALRKNGCRLKII